MRVYFHLPYRQAEGVVIAHVGTKIPSIPNYSTINRRVNTHDIRISELHEVGKDDDDDDIIIELDRTGIKVANRGEWMRHKWHVRRGYLKIHVAVNIKNKKIISLEITSEEVHDGKMLKKLVDHASENNNNVKVALADGSVDKTWRIATGAPLGPFQILDMVGLNTVYNIDAAENEEQRGLAQFLKENYIDKGKLGADSGEGFYSYASK